MDKRNSKESMLRKIDELETRVQNVYDAGCWGVAHVAKANYAHRESEAIQKLIEAMYGHKEKG